MYCASGDGIVNLHHMITLYTFLRWENAAFSRKGKIPYGILADWAGDKVLDAERKKRAAAAGVSRTPTETFEDFTGRFSFTDIDSSLDYLFYMLENFPHRTVDWIFRAYASEYDPRDSWDPHYITGLFCAVRLFLENRTGDRTAARMALDQAVRYFAEKGT
jgi:hypothetical protein